MLEDNKNKDDKEFSFIQEQIASKKRNKIKRMLYSVLWTAILACVFGIIAGITFCISEPTISKFLGREPDKKTVEFPTVSPEDENGNLSASISPTPEVDSEGNSKDDEISKQSEEETEPETVVIQQKVRADLKDLTNMYTELRTISNKVKASIITVTNTSSGVDVFGNEYEVSKSTSGLIVANNGAELLILVSLDKVWNANKIEISISDTEQIKAELQSYDSDLNLAVIAVNLEDIPSNRIDFIQPASLGESYSLAVGTPIIALGSPNGYVNSMELGIISSSGFTKYITDDKIDLFNTDISYNENGDGVIIGLNGDVIGIITRTLKDELNPDVNTVIGISRIKKIIESMVNNTDRIYLGIKGADMTEEALQKVGLTSGICITEVEADSPALTAELQSGDIIFAINGTPIKTVNSLNNILSIYNPKETVKVSILRSTKKTTKKIDVNVTLAKKTGKK